MTTETALLVIGLTFLACFGSVIYCIWQEGRRP